MREDGEMERWRDGEMRGNRDLGGDKEIGREREDDRRREGGGGDLPCIVTQQ
jgi:hypothetical protein